MSVNLAKSYTTKIRKNVFILCYEVQGRLCPTCESNQKPRKKLIKKYVSNLNLAPCGFVIIEFS